MITARDCEECKGCSVLGLKGECVTTATNKEGHECPCRKCLVKIMCNDGCENWKKYRGYEIDFDGMDFGRVFRIFKG
jgi:hypothetical protein